MVARLKVVSQTAGTIMSGGVAVGNKLNIDISVLALLVIIRRVRSLPTAR